MDGRMEDIHNRCIEVLNDLNLGTDNISDETKLVDDLGMDSLDTIELVVALEQEFMIDITDEVAESMKTFGDMKQIVNKELPA